MKKERREGGPYREPDIELPPDPRVSKLVLGALASSLASDALIVHAMVTDRSFEGQWVLALLLFAAGGFGAILAYRRVSQRDDLRGRRIAKAHLMGIGAKVALVALIVVAPGILFLLYFLLGGEITKGRPLFRGGRAVGVVPRRRASRRKRRASFVDRAIGRHWARVASYEHASVTAFAELELDLARLGAPRPLLQRIAMAQREEQRHARICLALARYVGGERWRPGRLPEPEVAPDSIETLAVRQLEEGCLGEGFSAAVLAFGADRASPGVARRLRVLAEDEAQHAEDAWAALAFLVNRGGDPVRLALRRRARRLSPFAPRTRALWLYAVDGRAHGLTGRRDEHRLHRALRAQVVERVERLIAVGEG